ncbi:MAG: sensor histidine kinase, partial [Planctomycetota bacterium]|jgi:signal transduction histidine kinase
VKQVLSFTPRTVNPELVQLPDIVRKAVELSRHRLTGKDIVLKDEMRDLPEIVGEPGELQQVFLNLIVNAADATERGGTITLEGRPVAGAVEVEVVDTGSGMSEEQISRAFDIFYTTKGQGEGSGLGLPIVHNIVQSHGGSIEIESNEGVGTTVRCRFPLPDAPGGESRRLIAKQKPPEALGL